MVFLMLSVPGAFPVNTFATDILMGTEAPGTFSHFAGRAFCRAINRHADGFTCQVVPAPDRIHNLTNLQGGSLDLALVEADMIYDAINKKGYFEFLDIRYDNLAGLMQAYDAAILLVARADAGIDSLDEIKGKRINAGAPRSRTRQAVDLILNLKGWTYQDFTTVNALPSSLSQDTMAFCHGSVQAMVHIGVHPDTTLQKLVSLCSARPVDMADPDITKMVQAHPAYTTITVPSDTYPVLGRAITTFGISVTLVASGSLDDETVKTIMAVLDAQQKSLRLAHPAMDGFDPAKEIAEIGIPLHPGAAAYLGRR
jgi:TRAP transporter TAXI family solute receptor